LIYFQERLNEIISVEALSKNQESPLISDGTFVFAMLAFNSGKHLDSTKIYRKFFNKQKSFSDNLSEKREYG